MFAVSKTKSLGFWLMFLVLNAKGCFFVEYREEKGALVSSSAGSALAG